MSVVLVGALAGAFCGGGVLGAVVAWWAHRRTRVSARSLYGLAPLGLLAWLGALAVRRPELLPLGALVGAAGITAGVMSRRYRLAALGAGGELREFELARHSLRAAVGGEQREWRARERTHGRRTRIAGQGELVRERGWPVGEPFVPMTADPDGARVPSRAGKHLLIVGATGSGKTVSARRWVSGRILEVSEAEAAGLGDGSPPSCPKGAAVLAVDPKGDAGLERDLRAAARFVGRPFVVFDPRDSESDRWNPLWSDDTGAVVSRLVAPISAGEGNARYYADLLQVHLGIVAAALRAAGLWPANVPLLLEAAQLSNLERLGRLVRERAGEDDEIHDRLREHRSTLASAELRRDLLGGILRLRVTAGETWRTVLTPDVGRGAVSLPAAMRAGAIVLVKTWVDDLPDEARAITTLFLADAAAAALTLPEGAQWAVLLDEFGGVLSSGAGERALALMQRARSAGGQVAVTTQSAVDFTAATGNPALLDALADNFAGGIFHAQSSPESRDWLSRLIGTREVWQSTDRTTRGGAGTDGMGSRRRVREFLVRPDELRTLEQGEAYIWSTLGPAPERVHVQLTRLPDSDRPPVSASALYTPCGPTSLAESADAPTKRGGGRTVTTAPSKSLTRRCEPSGNPHERSRRTARACAGPILRVAEADGRCLGGGL